MHILELPEFNAFLSGAGKPKTLFDPVRKKSVAATPEEFVRQFIIQYLIYEKHFPRALLGVEVALAVNKLSKRCDIVAYKNNKPALLIECKAPPVKISQNVFDQIARYNITLRVPYLLVTNGLIAMCCKLDLEKGRYEFLEEFPEYKLL